MVRTCFLRDPCFLWDCSQNCRPHGCPCRFDSWDPLSSDVLCAAFILAPFWYAVYLCGWWQFGNPKPEFELLLHLHKLSLSHILSLSSSLPLAYFHTISLSVCLTLHALPLASPLSPSLVINPGREAHWWWRDCCLPAMSPCACWSAIWTAQLCGTLYSNWLVSINESCPTCEWVMARISNHWATQMDRVKGAQQRCCRAPLEISRDPCTLIVGHSLVD